MLPRMLVEIMVITAGCFVAALVNAAVATGGVYIMLAASSAVLPLVAAIPMQAALAAPSLLARIVPSAYPHGSSPCSHRGDRRRADRVVFIALDEGVISVALGVLLLVWGVPKGYRSPCRTGFCMWEACTASSAHYSVSVCSATCHPANTAEPASSRHSCHVPSGAKREGHELCRRRIDYGDYWPHIVAGAVAGILGNFAGHRLSGGISERHFRTMFKLVVTLAGLRLLAKGVIDLGLF